MGRAAVFALACKDERAGEHIFFQPLPIDRSAVFRRFGVRSGKHAYQGRWKKLDQATVDSYFGLASEYSQEP
jgi:hypothetical protein